MNKALIALFRSLLNWWYIGEKHTPESKIIKSKIKWLCKKERKEFHKECGKEIKQNNTVIRIRKRTKKGSDWHISVNPRKIKEIIERIKWMVFCYDKKETDWCVLWNIWKHNWK